MFTKFATLGGLHALAILVVSLLGCAPRPATELVIRVGTNMDQGTELVGFRIRVARDGATQAIDDRTWSLVSGTYRLPNDMGVIPRNPSDGTRVIVDISANLPGQDNAFSQRAIVGFSDEHTLLLEMFLARECMNAAAREACEGRGQTCGAGGECVEVARPGLPELMPGGDAGTDSNSEAEVDTGSDAGVQDAGPEAEVDAGQDAGFIVDPGPQASCLPSTVSGCGLVALPGGTFSMSDDGSTGPIQPVTVGAFAIDAYEVTVARFRRYVAAGMPAPPGMAVAYRGASQAWAGPVATPPTRTGGEYCNWSTTVATPSREEHPVNGVDWYTAQAFCAWDGGRLPTEAEWEFAARGDASRGQPVPRTFPWGDQLPTTTCDRAQWSFCPGDDGSSSKRVGSFSATGGLFDLAGNVGEWTADWYAEYTSTGTGCWTGSAQTNPLCDTRIGVNAYRTIRGSGWNSGIYNLHSVSRQGGPPQVGSCLNGFRCARTR